MNIEHAFSIACVLCIVCMVVIQLKPSASPPFAFALNAILIASWGVLVGVMGWGFLGLLPR